VGDVSNETHVTPGALFTCIAPLPSIFRTLSQVRDRGLNCEIGVEGVPLGEKEMERVFVLGLDANLLRNVVELDLGFQRLVSPPQSITK
jgi:hypothetical protein